MLICAAIGYAVAVGLWRFKPVPTPTPGPPGNFVTLGISYNRTLGTVYAKAWEDGATLLESGQSVAMALDTVRAAWESNRLRAYNDAVTPEFSKVLPEGKPESEITTDQRKALAKAWREFARGLSK